MNIANVCKMAHRVSLGTGEPFASVSAPAALPPIRPRPARLPPGALLSFHPVWGVGAGVSPWTLEAWHARCPRVALSERRDAIETIPVGVLDNGKTVFLIEKLFLRGVRVILRVLGSPGPRGRPVPDRYLSNMRSHFTVSIYRDLPQAERR